MAVGIGRASPAAVGRHRPSTLLPVQAAVGAVASAVGVATGYLAAQDVSPFRVVLIGAAMALAPVLLLNLDLAAILFPAFLWARVSDVSIAEQGLPSLAVPFAIGLLGVALARRLVAGERIGAATFRGLLPVLPYVAVVVASIAWSAFPDRALTTAVGLLKDVLIFWVIAETLRRPGTLKAGLYALMLAVAALSLVSLHQYVTGNFGSSYGGFAQAEVRQIVDTVNGNRPGGPIGDPNFFAQILLVSLPIGFALLRTRLQPVARVTLGVCLPLIGLTTLLTFSRGGALILGLVLVLSLARYRIGLVQAASAAVVLIGIALAAPSSVWERIGTVVRPFGEQRELGQVIDASVDLRLSAQRVALEMFVDHPFLGVGASNYPPLYQDYARRLGVPAVAGEFFPHNLYLEVLAETGAVGLLAFVLVAFGPLLGLIRAQRGARSSGSEHDEWRELAYGVELALIAYLLASVLLHGSYPRYLWILLALAVAALAQAPRPHRSAALVAQ
jgi:putative inorganic carbon (hco3(-)) transporter